MIKLKIMTPAGITFEKAGKSLIIPTCEGCYGIMQRAEKAVYAVSAGTIIFDNEKIATEGGILSFDGENGVLCE